MADQMRSKLPKFATLMDTAEADVLAYMTFPQQYRTKLHSTDPIERLKCAITRRTDVVGIIPNKAFIRVRASRLTVGAILMEQTEEWTVQRGSYMTLEALTPVCDDPIVRLPAAQVGLPARPADIHQACHELHHVLGHGLRALADDTSFVYAKQPDNSCVPVQASEMLMARTADRLTPDCRSHHSTEQVSSEFSQILSRACDIRVGGEAEGA